MKCTRCEHEIERKEPMCSLYVRPSTDKQMALILCEMCSVDFVGWMKAGIPKEETEQNNPDVNTKA